MSAVEPIRVALAVALALALLAGCGTPYARRHLVQPGETVASIARSGGVSEAELRRFNRLGPGDEARPGDILFLPGPGGRAAPAPPQEPPAPRPPVAGPAPAPRPVRPEATPEGQPLRWPLDGEVLRGFSPGTTRGVDLAAQPGTPVGAAAAGRVTYAGQPARAYAPLVIVEHPNGLFTVYANLAGIRVQEGARVEAGEAVGTSGPAAGGLGPHLHFEVRRGDAVLDPLLFLPPR